MKSKVAIYVRSSNDLHDVSCKAQKDQLTEITRNKGESVYDVFEDKALSSTRDVRPAFDEMLGLAMSKNPPFKKIYCLDTSRFGRSHYESQIILHELRTKYGIDVIFSNMPNTGTYLDPVVEAIFQAFDYVHSQQSKAKGVAGMKQNVVNGYRAGGRSPYGYKAEKVEIAKHKNGDSITKTKLVPDEKTGSIAREYFQRRSKYETRKSIIEDFYRRGIPSPSGNKRWSMASAKSMEDNIDVYLGHTVFNRLNERLKEKGRFSGYLHGIKFKSKEEWVIHENTHEPIITEEMANVIRELKAKGIREPSGRAKRCYALSGLLKCSCCETNFVGDRGIYRCNSKTKPGLKCDNNDISQNKAEDALFSFIDAQILNFKNIQQVIQRIKKRFSNNGIDLSPLEKRLAELEKEQQKLKKLYMGGLVELEDIEDDLKGIKDQRTAVLNEIENQKKVSGAVDISEDVIKAVIEQFTDEVHAADPKIKKRAVQALFDEIRIFPKKGSPWERVFEIKGVHLPLTRVKVASPRGFEPLSPA